MLLHYGADCVQDFIQIYTQISKNYEQHRKFRKRKLQKKWKQISQMFADEVRTVAIEDAKNNASASDAKEFIN